MGFEDPEIDGGVDIHRVDLQGGFVKFLGVLRAFVSQFAKGVGAEDYRVERIFLCGLGKENFFLSGCESSSGLRQG